MIQTVRTVGGAAAMLFGGMRRAAGARCGRTNQAGIRSFGQARLRQVATSFGAAGSGAAASRAAGFVAVAVLWGVTALFGAVAAPAINWSRPQTVRVEMVDNRFVPDHLTFRHGVTYRLHLENHGKDMHEFTAPNFFAAAAVRNPRKLANGGQEVVVQPGKTADIDLVPQRPGTYDLTCADHDWDGMVGSIEVQ